MKRSQFLEALDNVVPLAAAGYIKDALGLQVGYGDTLSKILCAYEITDAVINEARQRGADLILTFHPLIFPSVREMNDQTRTGSLVAELIRTEIAVYSLHTAFDTLPKIGTSWQMANALELNDTSLLEPLRSHEGFGMGVIGALIEPHTPASFLEKVKALFSTPVLRAAKFQRGHVRRVAMVGGSGMDYYGAAVRAGADAFITADVRYHDFYRAEHDGILLVDAGHAETERFVVEGMAIAAKKAVQLVLEKQGASGDESIPPAVLESEAAPNAVLYYF